MSRWNLLLAFFCLLVVSNYAVGEVVELDITSTQQFPVSAIIQPGSTVRFTASDALQHKLVSISNKFMPVEGPFNPTAPFTNSFEMDFDNSTAGETFFFTDTTSLSSYGFIIVADESDTYIPFSLFGPGMNLADWYPYNVTISKGERVIWDASEEAGIIHSVSLADSEYRPMFSDLWEILPTTLRSPRFPFTFTERGIYYYVCSFHQSMRGAVTVCDENGANCPTPLPSPSVTPTPTTTPQPDAGTVINFNFKGMLGN